MEVELIEKAIKIIEVNLTNTAFTTEALSKELFMSRSHLHRKLNEHTGKNTTEFIRDIRLENAAKLLLKPNRIVADVAYKTGFSNLSWFAKCFKQKYGVPPSKYRKWKRSYT